MIGEKRRLLAHGFAETFRKPSLVYWVFNLPARLVSHARRLCARVSRSLLERADFLVSRAQLRVAHCYVLGLPADGGQLVF
jgi:hypothetical protein